MAWKLGEIHHARWMGSCRFILKILLCLSFFYLGPTQKADVLAHAFYIVYIHFYYWFNATWLADIPLLTLQLHEDLVLWQKRDPDAARAALRKVDLHTDYLSGRSVIFALASKKVDNKTKQAMVEALKAVERGIPVEKGNPELPRIYDDSKLPDFINEESWMFFEVNKMLNEDIFVSSRKRNNLQFIFCLNA